MGTLLEDFGAAIADRRSRRNRRRVFYFTAALLLIASGAIATHFIEAAFAPAHGAVLYSHAKRAGSPQ